MPKFDEMLYPANLLQPGDVIVTRSANQPSYYTVAQINRLKVCFEIVCEPYRRFVLQPTDGLWIKWTHEAAARPQLARGACDEPPATAA